MKTLSDILVSLQTARRLFSAEVIDNALKITCKTGETAYVPNQMSDKAYEAYHILLNIPLPRTAKPAEPSFKAEPIKADLPFKTEPAPAPASAPAAPAAGQIEAAPIIIAPEDYHQAPPGARDEDWDSAFFADRGERIPRR